LGEDDDGLDEEQILVTARHSDLPFTCTKIPLGVIGISRTKSGTAQKTPLSWLVPYFLPNIEYYSCSISSLSFYYKMYLQSRHS